MEKNKLKIKSPKIGIYFNIVAILSFIIALSFILINWSTLPNKVPSHYNLAGEPDKWSDRWFVFVPLMIGIFLWFSLQIVETRPHLHNYSGLTEKNREVLFKNSMLLMNFIKNEMLIYFSFSAINDIYVAKGKESIVGPWDLLIFSVMIIGTIVIFVVRSVRLKKEVS
ncbi:MAG: DUF1648 domain-containing protein [Rummeliibacillus sp.]